MPAFTAPRLSTDPLHPITRPKPIPFDQPARSPKTHSHWQFWQFVRAHGPQGCIQVKNCIEQKLTLKIINGYLTFGYWYFFTVIPNAAQPRIYVIINKTNQAWASSFCISLGGSIPSANNESQLIEIANTTGSHKLCMNQYWTAVVKTKDNLNWVTMDKFGNKIKTEFLPWNQGSTDIPDENCVIIDHSLMFQTEKCSLEHCFHCQFQQQV